MFNRILILFCIYFRLVFKICSNLILFVLKDYSCLNVCAAFFLCLVFLFYFHPFLLFVFFYFVGPAIHLSNVRGPVILDLSPSLFEVHFRPNLGLVPAHSRRPPNQHNIRPIQQTSQAIRCNPGSHNAKLNRPATLAVCTPQLTAHAPSEGSFLARHAARDYHCDTQAQAISFVTNALIASVAHHRCKNAYNVHWTAKWPSRKGLVFICISQG